MVHNVFQNADVHFSTSIYLRVFQLTRYCLLTHPEPKNKGPWKERQLVTLIESNQMSTIKNLGAWILKGRLHLDSVTLLTTPADTAIIRPLSCCSYVTLHQVYDQIPNFLSKLIS
jgi:hypothetical protein